MRKSRIGQRATYNGLPCQRFGRATNLPSGSSRYALVRRSGCTAPSNRPSRIRVCSASAAPKGWEPRSHVRNFRTDTLTDSGPGDFPSPGPPGFRKSRVLTFRSERGPSSVGSSPDSGHPVQPGSPTRGVAMALCGWSNVADHPRSRGELARKAALPTASKPSRRLAGATEARRRGVDRGDGRNEKGAAQGDCAAPVPHASVSERPARPGPWALRERRPACLEILGIGGDGRLSLKATELVPSCGSASNSNFYVVARE